jgi:hypothetical protein
MIDSNWISEAKQCTVRSVFGWVTAEEMSIQYFIITNVKNSFKKSHSRSQKVK